MNSKYRAKVCVLCNLEDHDLNGAIYSMFGNRCAQRMGRLCFDAAHYITHSLTFFDRLLIHLHPRKATLRFSSFKENVIRICAVQPVMSPLVEFISLAKRVATDFCHFFLNYFGYCSHCNYHIKEHRLPCSFYWKKKLLLFCRAA